MENSTTSQAEYPKNLVALCHKNFVWFYNFIWGFSIELMEGSFKTGQHLNTWCNLFQMQRMLSIVSARKHSKSEITHAYLGWRIFNMDYRWIERWYYFSYLEDLAGMHLEETKERISVNPFFQKEGIEDLTTAKTILYYRKGSRRLFVKPCGILSAKRGGHPDGVITDDILRDPDNPMNISQILKINEIFTQQILSMPKEGGLGLKNIGTMQDENDTFHLLEGMKQFSCHRYPAEVDSVKQVSLWPQMFSWNRLKEIENEEIGKKAYQKEYLCVPIRSAEGFFNKDEIDAVIYERLKNRIHFEPIKLREYTYGGLDIGKKRHPSHLSIYGKTRKGKLIQILSIWFDHMDYKDQIGNCRLAIDAFKIQKLIYDDTRAEFEGFKEVGTLPPQMEGISFTDKIKHKIAVSFEKKVNSKDIMLINDQRQKRQILNCDNDLKSMETPEGHGDSFWSNALAIYASELPPLNIRFI